MLAGIVIQIPVTATSNTAFGGSPLNQVFNMLAYFTIDSNILVGVACLLLALDLNRPSLVFAVVRMMGLVGITVTFVVFHVALSRLLDLDTWAQTANQLQHTVVPILTMVGWLAFGPRGLTSVRVVRLTVLFPVAYIVFTAIRGPLSSNFYPYPFADVHALGYARVIVNGVWISLLFLGVAAGAAWLDRRISSKA